MDTVRRYNVVAGLLDTLLTQRPTALIDEGLILLEEVAIESTERRNDTGLAPASVGQVVARGGKTPERLLADQKAMTRDDTAVLAATHPRQAVYSPSPKERADVTAETPRNRRYHRRREPEAVKQWRARLGSDEGKGRTGDRSSPSLCTPSGRTAGSIECWRTV